MGDLGVAQICMAIYCFLVCTVPPIAFIIVGANGQKNHIPKDQVVVENAICNSTEVLSMYTVASNNDDNRNRNEPEVKCAVIYRLTPLAVERSSHCSFNGEINCPCNVGGTCDHSLSCSNNTCVKLLENKMYLFEAPRHITDRWYLKNKNTEAKKWCNANALDTFTCYYTAGYDARWSTGLFARNIKLGRVFKSEQATRDHVGAAAIGNIVLIVLGSIWGCGCLCSVCVLLVTVLKP